jgi:hypothetical protein
MNGPETYALCLDICELARKHVQYSGMTYDVFIMPRELRLDGDAPGTVLKWALHAAGVGGKPHVSMKDGETLIFHHH